MHGPCVNISSVLDHTHIELYVMELYEENDKNKKRIIINNLNNTTRACRHRHISRLRSLGSVCRTHRERLWNGTRGQYRGTRDSTVQNIKSCINVQQVFSLLFLRNNNLLVVSEL